jgi:hypothetical protein
VQLQVVEEETEEEEDEVGISPEQLVAGPRASAAAAAQREVGINDNDDDTEGEGNLRITLSRIQVHCTLYSCYIKTDRHRRSTLDFHTSPFLQLFRAVSSIINHMNLEPK